MADEEYNKKLQSLQQYIPFLNNMIQQLKDPRMKNREQQLQKLESLHSMITDKKKKLKLDTLIKCEDVILKLFHKVKSGSQNMQSRPTPQPSSLPLPPPIHPQSIPTNKIMPPSSGPKQFPPKIHPPLPPLPVVKQPPPIPIHSLADTPDSPPITPSSPSPPPMMPVIRPVVIPTEKVVETIQNKFHDLNSSATTTTSTTSSFKPKIDIYSSVADSLAKTSPKSKPSVFSRLGYQPDMSKPPISLEDLKALEADGPDSPSNKRDPESMSLNELTDLREKLQRKLSNEEKTVVVKSPVKRKEKSPIRAPSPFSWNYNKLERPKLVETDKNKLSIKIEEKNKSPVKVEDKTKPLLSVKIDDKINKPLVKINETTTKSSVKIDDKMTKSSVKIDDKTTKSSVKIDDKMTKSSVKIDDKTSKSSPEKIESKVKIDTNDDSSKSLKDPKLKTETSNEPNKGKEKTPKISTKIIKEVDNIFGSTLSNIDNKILESAGNRHKREERTSSSSSRDGKDKKDERSAISKDVKKNKSDSKDIKDKHDSKERRSSKDEKKSESSHKSKDRTTAEKKESSSRSKDKKSEKIESKDKRNEKTDIRDATKTDTKEAKSRNDPRIKNKDEKEKSESSISENKDSISNEKDQKVENLPAKPEKIEEVSTNNTIENKPKIEPVYKRLADKYNPRPRKTSIDNEPSKIVPQAAAPTPSIPFLDAHTINTASKILSNLPPNVVNFLKNVSSTTSSSSTGSENDFNQKNEERPLIPQLNEYLSNHGSTNQQQPQPQHSQLQQSFVEDNFQSPPNVFQHPQNFPNKIQALSPPFQQMPNNFPAAATQNFEFNQQPHNQMPVVGGAFHPGNSPSPVRINQSAINAPNIHQPGRIPPSVPVNNQPLLSPNADMYRSLPRQYPPYEQHPQNDLNFANNNQQFNPYPAPVVSPSFDNPRNFPDMRQMPRHDEYYEGEWRTEIVEPRRPESRCGGRFNSNYRERNMNRYQDGRDDRYNQDNYRGEGRYSTDRDFRDSTNRFKDVDLRFQQPELPPSTSREKRFQDNSRYDDSRDNRDYRGNDYNSYDPRISSNRGEHYRGGEVDRDPRTPREDPRLARATSRARDGGRPNRDDYRSRDRSRYRYRDPRLNRFVREKSRSRSRSRSKDDESFSSPLDSLYTGDGSRKTGKGYGVQTFRLPKIKKENDTSETVINEMSDQSNVENLPESELNVDSTSVEINKEKLVDESIESIPNKADESKGKEVENSEITSTITETEPQQPQQQETPKFNEADIINQFLKTLLQNDKTRAAASLFIDNVTNSLNDDKLKMMVETVKSAKIIEPTATTKTDETPKEEDDDDDDDGDDADDDDDDDDDDDEEVEEEEEKPEKSRTVKPKKRKRISNLTGRKKRKKPPVKLDSSEEKDNKSEKRKVDAPVSKSKEKEQVIVSVGERIKNRRRTAVIQSHPRRYKTELDLLHEDIQDMFIRDGVLTATGKRMCRILTEEKQQHQDGKGAETAATRPKRARTAVKKFDANTPPNSAQIKKMSSVKVLLPKLTLNEEESKRYSLRRSAKNASYNENSEEEDDKKKQEEPEPKIEEVKISAKAKQKDKKAVEDDDDEEEEEEEEEEKPSTPKKTKVIKKRNRGWASGVIPKRKRPSEKLVLETEEEEKKSPEKPSELIEPDKFYYTQKGSNSRLKCKICHFQGKNITNHYVFSHPENEVLSSRISPEKAEAAIADSIKLELDKKVDEEYIKIGNCRYSFQCCFCDQVLVSNMAGAFYDHLSEHTGEFRHHCQKCSFTGSNRRRVRLHTKNVHGEKRKVVVPSFEHNLHGYICSACNYVQMARNKVEEHVNIYHLGNDHKIYRINLAIELKKLSRVNDESVNSDSNKKIKRGGKRKIEDDDDDYDDEDNDGDGGGCINSEGEEHDEKKVEVPPVKTKDIDMNVFTCNTDIFDDSEKIEQERLKAMTEVNKSVKTSRLSLNFIDELSNRLKQEKNEDEQQEKRQKSDESHQKLEVKPPPIVKTEPIEMPDDLDNEKMGGVFDKIETSAKKHSMTTLRPTTALAPVEIVAKQNVSITGMIEKLRGILKDDPPQQESQQQQTDNDDSQESRAESQESLDLHLESDSPEPPPPINEEQQHNEEVPKEGTNCLQIATIESLLKNNGGQQADVFTLEGPPPLTPITDRSSEGKVVLAAGFLNIIKDEFNLEYVCRIPSCCFTTKCRNSFLTHWENDHVNINNSHKNTMCKICSKHIEATASELLLLRFFNHIETSHEDILSFHRKTLRIRRLSGDKLSGENAAPIQEISSSDDTTVDVPVMEEDDEDNPFPFKISGVMSLADDNATSVVDPKESKAATSPTVTTVTSATSPKKIIGSIFLREHKATRKEMEQHKKHPVPQNYLNRPQDLYKCPKLFCNFTTNLREVIDAHCAVHTENSGVLCAYCLVKIPINQVGVHTDFRHSNSLYSCTKCLYRAVAKEYVVVHMMLQHNQHFTFHIYNLEGFVKPMMKMKPKTFSIENSCSPYVCGMRGCGKQYWYQNEFRQHLKKEHTSIVYVCGVPLSDERQCHFVGSDSNLIDHYTSKHKLHEFVCLLCKYGASTTTTMLSHYAAKHQNQEIHVVDRTGLNPDPKDQILKAYGNGKIVFVKSNGETPASTASSSTLLSTFALIPTENTASPTVSSSDPTTRKSSLPIIDLDNDNVGDKDEGMVVDSSEMTTTSATANSSPVDAFEEPSILQSENTSNLDLDPLSLDTDLIMSQNSSNATINASGDDSDGQEGIESADKNFGLLSYQLYRCAFCDISFSNSKDFKIHCINSKLCQDSANKVRPFRCVHCSRAFRNAHGLLEHIHYHGPLRFSCSLCVRKFPSPSSIKVHMRLKHSVTNTVITPVLANRGNLERDEFILRPKPVDEQIADDDDLGNQHQSEIEFSPDQIDSLPKRHIFTSEVKCALCSYSTKVRTNLIRHLQFHSAEKSVPDIAPVNPVPCLDKNEKMFDKMTNLAISSFTGGRMGGMKTDPSKVEETIELPAYVPANRRYVCCANGCNYLSIDESTLRHHLYALHGSEVSFICVHCKQDMKPDVDLFIKHLKLHDLHLYKCAYCKFIHNLRHKVEKHSTEKHSDKLSKVITVRSLETLETLEKADLSTINQQQQQQHQQLQLQQEQQQIQQSQQAAAVEVPGTSSGITNATAIIKFTKPWHCGMCKYRCAAKNDVVAHILNKHDMNAQYKCTLCTYYTNEKNTFDGHFKETHPENEIDIIHIYYKSEGGKNTSAEAKSFDTTPLWQRDRPRVRHIRGILFEESPKTSTKKSSKSSSGPNITFVAPSPNSLDKSIEAVVSGTTSTTPIKDKVSVESKNVEKKKAAATTTTLATTSTIQEKTDKDDGKLSPVIIIEDEDSLDVDIEGDFTPPQLVIDESAEIKMEDAENLLVIVEQDALNNVERLSERTLVKQYGSICRPFGKFYKCPFCKYKTRKVEYFIYHLLCDMKIKRYSCNSCSYTDVTYDSMKCHAEQKHNNLAITKLELPQNLIFWLELLIYRQTESVVATMQIDNLLHDGVDQLSRHHRVYCSGCRKWFKNITVMKNHELTHWLEQDYICFSCDSKLEDLLKFFAHINWVHPNEAVRLKTRQYCVETILETLTNPSLSSGSDSGSATSSPTASSSSSGGGSTVSPSSTATSYDDQMYLCFYCMESKHTMTALHDHWREKHQSDNPTFNYRVISKSKTEHVFYCCSYCHEKSTKELLIEHHKEKHKDTKFKIYQLICLECSETFLTNTEVRSHFIKTHYGKRLSYCEIERKVSSTYLYPCYKCPFKSGTSSGIRTHLRKHIRPVECKACGIFFITLSEARTHHQRDHPNDPRSLEDNRERVQELETLYFDACTKKYLSIPAKLEEETLVAEDANATTDNSDVATLTVITEPETTPKVKPRANIAKKSTGAPQNKQIVKAATEVMDVEGESFYGRELEEDNLKTIQTTIEVNKVKTTITVEQFSNIMNIFPVVKVADVSKLSVEEEDHDQQQQQQQQQQEQEQQEQPQEQQLQKS